MRRFYHTARKATLRDFPWSFANKRVKLGLISVNVGESCQGQTGGPAPWPFQNGPYPVFSTTPRWRYTYAIPSDCLHFIKILSDRMNDTRQSRVPYELGYGEASEVLHTNREHAQGEYTVDVDQVARFSPDFILAFSFRLAMYGAPQLTAGDPYKLGAAAQGKYALEISRAKATAVNENQEFQDPESEFIRERNGYGQYETIV
jgi:hypothetical protein